MTNINLLKFDYMNDLSVFTQTKDRLRQSSINALGLPAVQTPMNQYNLSPANMRQTGRKNSPSPRRASKERLDTNDILKKKKRKQPKTKFVSLSKYDRIKDEVHK